MDEAVCLFVLRSGRDVQANIGLVLYNPTPAPRQGVQ